MIQKADNDTGEDKASAKEHDQKYDFLVSVGHFAAATLAGVGGTTVAVVLKKFFKR
jgi:hypothetical protein